MSSQSENIETEAQKQADIQKLTAVFVVIVAFFQNIFNAFNNSSRVTAIFALFAIIIILTLMILSYMYIRQLLIDYSVSKLISNPLNLEAPDYVISKSTQFLGSKYKYQLFIILPIISFICCLIALLYPNTFILIIIK